MYPAHYESWFPAESQESDSQGSYASQTPEYNHIESYHDYSSMHNPSLSPIHLNSHSDPFNYDNLAPIDTPSLLFSSTGTGIEAPKAVHSDDSHISGLDIDALLKSNTPRDLLQLFSADLIQRRAGVSRWEIECPDCKDWIKTTLPTRMLTGLNSPGYFNTLSDHRHGKKCSKRALQLKSSPSSSNSGRISSSTLPTTESSALMTLAQKSDVISTACTGVPIYWPVRGPSFLETFPVGCASDGPGMLLFDIDTRGTIPHAYSKDCERHTTPGSPCTECLDIVPSLEHMVTIAQDIKPQVHYRYRSHFDMVQVARQYAEEANRLKLKGLNDARRVTHVLTRLDDYKSLIIALSENDVPRIQHILTVTLKRGSSIQQVINTLEDAITGTYHPRGYTGDDLDIAILMYHLGGRQLLYALSHRLGLPSLRTLQTHRTFTSISPTIGPITAEQFDANIKTLILIPLQSTIVPRRGYSIMMDEIALEERASHHHASNSVVGLYHSHSHLVDPTLHTYDSVLCIAEKLAEGLIHLGKEMSVLAVGSFGDDEIFPILTAPTCKCEDAEKMVSIFTLAIDRWRETGAEEQLGPIFSVATDGDSTRRAAGHCMFLKHELSMVYRLYGTLSHMPGLNLTTGDCEITLDFDYKHIFKHECLFFHALLDMRLTSMKLNNGHSVTSAVLARYLTWLPDMDESAVTRLLNPDDPQDVPHTVELMQAIIALSKFKINTITGDVESLLLPFIDITLSLQQQVTYLSRYAHLTFTFFRLYHSTFMPHVLYYDSQTMAKNACFCIAKQQRLDGSQNFWLIQMGDDRLEKLFGITRMRGQHNSAMNYSQALDRISAAKDINTVFKKHPDLESGSRRLKITCTEGLDHIHRDLWVRDVVASHCDLPSAWKDGRERAALNVLADAHMPARGCDLMRPWGANKYLGVMLDVEDVESSTNSAIPLATATADDESELDEDILSLEEALTHDLASGNPNINTTILSVSDSNTPTLIIGPGINPDGFLLVDGKYIHKETICRRVLNKFFITKSLNRQERVYSTDFTKVNRRHELPGWSNTGGNTFIIGDIFLTIVCSNATLTIALVRSTLIEHHGITRHDILVANIGTPEVKLTGQILTLIPTFQPAEQRSWLWTGEYVKMKSDIQGINQSTDKIVEIMVPGILVELANPETTCVRMRSNINSDNFFALNNLGNTWIIEEAALSFACNTLWRKACENNIILKSIIHLATPSDPSTFLYSLADGSTGVVCAEASEQLAATNAGPLLECPLCSGKTDSMHAHIGVHILRICRRTWAPDNLVAAAGDLDAKSARWASANAGSKNRPCRNVPIKCELCHPTLAPVTGKKSRTGAPYVDAIWHYNMIDHLNKTHPQYAHPKKTHGHPLPPDILDSFTLTSLEQCEAGIPE
ncbi:hypothetical protein BDR05DRAFT_951816, partial [Suillus weaverae]